MQRRRRVGRLIVVVTTIGVIVLGIAVSFPIRRHYIAKAAVQTQQAAQYAFVEQIKKLGGKIRYASHVSEDSLELASIDRIDLSGTAADGSVIKAFPGLKHLQRLLLDDTKLQPGDLEPLAGLAKLESLSLARTTIGRSDIACISKLPKLKTLSLEGTSITDTDVEPLMGLRALTSLDISRTRLTADGTKILQGLSALQTITLDDQCITPESVVCLSSLKNLQMVEICVANGLGKESRVLVSGKLKAFVVGINPQGVKLWEADSPWDETLAGVVDAVEMEFPLDAKEVERLIRALGDKNFKRPVPFFPFQRGANQMSEPVGPAITSCEQFIEALRLREVMPKSVRVFARDRFTTRDIPVLVEAMRTYEYSGQGDGLLWWGPFLLAQHGLDDPAAIEQLDRLLNHSHPRVRGAAVYSLGQGHARQLYTDWFPSEKLVEFAVPHLVRLSLDEDLPVRGSVAEVLGDLAAHHPKYSPQAMTGLVNILRQGNGYSYTIRSISRIAEVNTQAALAVVPELRGLLKEPPPDFSKENAKRELRPGTLENSFRSSIQQAIGCIAKYSPPLALEIVREARANNLYPPNLEFSSPENREAVEILLHDLLAGDEQSKSAALGLLSICVQIRDWRSQPPATSSPNN